jgi:hypothetical protein
MVAVARLPPSFHRQIYNKTVMFFPPSPAEKKQSIEPALILISIIM